jgi:hypothetical protein
VTERGQQESTLNGCGEELLHDRDGLPAQGHDVLNLHLHHLPGDAPFGLVEIEVCSLGFAQLTGSNKHQGDSFSASYVSRRPL